MCCLLLQVLFPWWVMMTSAHHDTLHQNVTQCPTAVWNPKHRPHSLKCLLKSREGWKESWSLYFLHHIHHIPMSTLLWLQDVIKIKNRWYKEQSEIERERQSLYHYYYHLVIPSCKSFTHFTFTKRRVKWANCQLIDNYLETYFPIFSCSLQQLVTEASLLAPGRGCAVREARPVLPLWCSGDLRNYSAYHSIALIRLHELYNRLINFLWGIILFAWCLWSLKRPIVSRKV